jgi:hypothetical protein
MGLKEDVTTGLAGLIWGTVDGDIPQANMREAGFDPANPELRQAIALSRQLLGLGFPESHAASFAVLVYVSSWIKRHYPEGTSKNSCGASPANQIPVLADDCGGRPWLSWGSTMSTGA